MSNNSSVMLGSGGMYFDNETVAKFAQENSHVPMWKARIIYCTILGFISLYICTMHVIFQHKVRMYRPSQSKRKGIKWLNILLTIASLAVIVRNFGNIEYYVKPTKEICLIMEKVEVISYAVAIEAMYVFLWIRQRLIYSNPILNINNMFFKFFSFSVLIISVIGNVINVVIFAFYTKLDVSWEGICEFTDRGFLFENQFYFLSTCFIVEQLLLLVLFLYPLIREYYKNKNVGSKINRSQIRLFSVIKRVFISALVCVVCDTVLALVAGVFHYHYSVMNFCFSSNLTINLLSLMCSFKSWKQELFPFIV